MLTFWLPTMLPSRLRALDRHLDVEDGIDRAQEPADVVDLRGVEVDLPRRGSR
jgi:hypothetical protein